VSLSPSRRTVLKGAVVLAALPVADFTTERRRSPILADPFALGVASGDPASDGVVIWTRLAPTPLADDGLGGMPDRAVDVEWEIADDGQFTRIAQRGMTVATPELAHSVHLELTGLRPGADYFYRFRTGGHISPTGRTRTAPAQCSLAPLTICVASCANYEQGWFTAYRRCSSRSWT
jgi:alkaline phosphatase D